MKFNRNINAVSDYDEVVATVEKYIAGLKIASIDGLKQAFHTDAIMYGFGPDGLLGGTINNLYTFVEHFGAAPNITTRVDVLDMTPTTAVARVTMEHDAADEDYTDFHCLIKIDGAWRVVAKLFHRYEK